MTTDNTRPQPAPKHVEGARAVWPLVIEDLQYRPGPWPVPRELEEAVAADMKARDDFGRAKYGTPLQVGNGRDHLADAYQEALDMAVYLKAWALEGNDPSYYRRALTCVLELRALLLERDGR